MKTNLSQKEKELISEPSGPSEPPVITPVLSKPELVPEPKLMPASVFASVNKKNHHIGRWLLIFIVLLILVAGGYELYVWELGRGQAPVIGHYHPAPAATNNASQPFPLAGGTPPVASTTTPPAAATTTPVAILQVKINSTPTGFLNVRNAPSISGKVLTQVHPGEIYTYTKVQNNWYQITYSGFEQGWVSGQYVTKQ